MELLFIFILIIALVVANKIQFLGKRAIRRDYYRNDYLKSQAWQRKRYVVLKRDNWRCVYCGTIATEVHHLRYAKNNIGKEPIDWLVSVCKECHAKKHIRNN